MCAMPAELAHAAWPWSTATPPCPARDADAHYKMDPEGESFDARMSMVYWCGGVMAVVVCLVRCAPVGSFVHRSWFVQL